MGNWKIENSHPPQIGVPGSKIDKFTIHESRPGWLDYFGDNLQGQIAILCTVLFPSELVARRNHRME